MTCSHAQTDAKFGADGGVNSGTLNRRAAYWTACETLLNIEVNVHIGLMCHVLSDVRFVA